MKTWIWLGGFLFFLCVTSAAFLFLPPPGAIGRELRREGGLEARRERIVESLREVARQGFSTIEALWREELEELRVRLRSIDRSRLREAAARASAAHGGEAALGELRAALERERRQADFDLLAVVFRGGETVAAGRETVGVKTAAAFEEIRSACLREGGESTGVEALPDDELSTQFRSRDPFLYAVAAVSLGAAQGPDDAVLLGCVELRRLGPRFEAALRTVDPRLRFHVALDAPLGIPRLVLGEGSGSAVRTALMHAVSGGKVTEEPAFTQLGPQVGRWRGILSVRGRPLGAWGVTMDPVEVEAALKARGPETKRTASARLPVPGLLDLAIAAGTLIVGLAVLWGFLALWARAAGNRTGVSSNGACDRPAPQRRARRAGKRRAALERIEERLEELARAVSELAKRGAAPPEALDRKIARELSLLSRKVSELAGEKAAREVEEVEKAWRARVEELLEEVERFESDAREGRDVDRRLALLEGENRKLEARVGELARELEWAREEAARLHALEEALAECGSPGALVTFDEKKCVRMWNGQAERVFGLPRERAVGRDLSLLEAEAGSLGPQLSKVVRQALEDGVAVLASAEAEGRRVRFEVRPLVTSEGKPRGVLVCAAGEAG